MTIQGNPLQMARDISEGFYLISSATLKSMSPSDLKTIKQSVAIVQREIRAEQVPLEDIMAIKKKNMKLQRLNQTLMVINSYCKQKRIPV